MLFQSNLTARREARERLTAFAEQAGGVTIDEVDDASFPSVFIVTFHAAGFAPPADDLVRPVHPVPRSEHTVQIALPPDYPVGVPVITWLSPLFHPNVAGGAVCLPFDGTDLAAACRAVIDLAAYRTYEVRPEDFGGGGFLNLTAAAWALSPEGQQQITARGGTPLTERRRPRVQLQVEPV